MTDSIFFTGPSGTGKTTTARLMASEMAYSVIDNISRNSPYAHEYGSIEHQMFVSESVWNHCRDSFNVIHCRTPLDVYAYSYAYGIKESQARDYDRVLQFADLGAPVIFFPLYWSPQVEKGRNSDMALNRVVEEVIMSAIEDLMIDCYVVKNESTRDRVNNIFEYLG